MITPNFSIPNLLFNFRHNFKYFLLPLLILSTIVSLEKELSASIFKGPATKPLVALTFDDGPKPDYALPILNILQRHKVRATFFIVGTQAEKHPDIIRRMKTEGHDIGNHSWSHPNLKKLSDSDVLNEITKTNSLIESITGDRPTYFRSPGGQYDLRVKNIIEKSNMIHVMWNINGKDYSQASQLIQHSQNFKKKPNHFEPPLADHILRKLENGSIILLHNGGNKIETQLEDIIIKLKREGYSLVPLSELLGQSLL